VSADDPFVWMALAVITVCVVGYFGLMSAAEAYRIKRDGETRTWDSRSERPVASSPGDGGPAWWPPKHAFALVRQTDPEFSAVLFEDFVYGLYAAAHRARHSRESLALLAPYLSIPARNGLRALPPEGAIVQSVVVGAMRVLGARPNPPDPARRSHEIKIEIELAMARRTRSSPIHLRWRRRARSPGCCGTWMRPQNAGTPYKHGGNDQTRTSLPASRSTSSRHMPAMRRCSRARDSRRGCRTSRG